MSAGLRAPFTASSFPTGSGVPYYGDMMFTLSELLHALFVTGRASGDEWAHGSASLFEWVHRVSVVPAYLARRPGGLLRRTSLADTLDRSEKVNLSYALGQAGTALFAQSQLGVTRLLHFDRYGRTHGAVLSSRRSPDLFGMGTGGWVIAESKGRSNTSDLRFAREAKTQASMVLSVSGQAPWCRAGIVTFFDNPNRNMGLAAVDPPPDEEAVALPTVDVSRVDYAYYSAFASAVGDDADDEVVDGEQYRVRRLDGIDLTLGLHVEIYERVRQAGRSRVLDLDEVRIPLSDLRRPEVLPDGTLVRAVWELNTDDGSGNERVYG